MPCWQQHIIPQISIDILASIEQSRPLLLQVLERANATEYGLAAGVFTSNLNWATTLSRGLKAGTVWVNTWNVFDAGVPFGGYKLSGIGREHGEACLSHYTQVTLHISLISPLLDMLT